MIKRTGFESHKERSYDTNSRTGDELSETWLKLGVFCFGRWFMTTQIDSVVPFKRCTLLFTFIMSNFAYNIVLWFNHCFIL